MTEMKMIRNAKNAVVGASNKVAAVGTGLLVGMGSAMATPPAGFDATEITDKIAANAVIAGVIIGAFILAVWGLRSLGLLRGK